MGAMPLRKLPPELGELVQPHRPLHPVLGWGIIAALSLPLALMASFMAPGPLVGLAILLGFGVPLTHGSAELLLLEHRLYEHGIVFRSIPGLNRYVVPHQTIDLDSFEIGGRRLHDGGVVAAVDRRFRQCPLVEPTIRFDGLDLRYAARLGKNRLSWKDALYAEQRSGNGGTRPTNRWMATYRDPERHLELIRSTVHASQARFRPR
jgi:hypothetical protein